MATSRTTTTTTTTSLTNAISHSTPTATSITPAPLELHYTTTNGKICGCKHATSHTFYTFDNWSLCWSHLQNIIVKSCFFFHYSFTTNIVIFIFYRFELLLEQRQRGPRPMNERLSTNIQPCKPLLAGWIVGAIWWWWQNTYVQLRALLMWWIIGDDMYDALAPPLLC
jgi:hypothetical protein